VVDAYVEGATAKTRYKAFLRMLKQVLPQAAEHMTDKKFAHFYDRLPPEKKREIESRRVVQSGVAHSKGSKRRNEQQKWAKEAGNLVDVMDVMYSDDEADDLREEVEATRQQEGDFRARKGARNATARKRPKAAQSGNAPRAPRVPPARAAPTPPTVLSTDDIRLDPDGKLARRVGMTAVLKKPSNSATGMHPAILVLMHPTTNTAERNGAVQISCRAINDYTLQLIWHEQTDRPVTELLPKLQAENDPGHEGPKRAQVFIQQCKSILGAGFSELDCAFDSMKPNEVGELHVNIISPERIITDSRNWAAVACGHDNKSKFFVIPLYETNKVQEIEYGLNVM